MCVIEGWRPRNRDDDRLGVRMDYRDQMFVGILFLLRGFRQGLDGVVGVLEVKGCEGREGVGDGDRGVGAGRAVRGWAAILGATPCRTR